MTSQTRRRTPQMIHRLLKTHRQRRQNRAASVSWRLGRFAAVLGLILLAAGLLAVLGAGGYYLAAVKNLPSVDHLAHSLDPALMAGPTRFYDRTGEIVLYELGYAGVERRWLSVDPAEPQHFSPRFIQAATALEENFWTGAGISFAHWAEPRPYTMIEQLIAEFLLPQELIEEQRGPALRVLALQAQLKYGKTWILEGYLNTAYFGRTVYGADQAAQVYLGKSASQLDLAESALLLAVLATPSLNPLDAPVEAAQGARIILDQLAASGQYSESDIQQARQSVVHINPVYRAEPERYEWVGYAFDQAAAVVSESRLERGGMRVITTLDAGLQAQLLCTLQAQVKQFNPAGQTNPLIVGCPAAEQPAAAVDGMNGPAAANSLLLDPAQGEILAWSGVISSGSRQTRPVYQAGSLLTPFFAAAAFSRGMSPAALVWDVPQDGQTDNLNPDGRWHGAQSLRRVVENGYLDAVYHTAETVGFDQVWMLASTLGLDSLKRSEFAADLAGGGGDTSLLELGQAFSTFASLGTQNGLLGADGRIQPTAVLRVEDAGGQVWLEEQQRVSRPVLDEGLAYLVNDLLDAGASHTGLEIGRPAAVAVRTAAGGAQAWTVGYTPERVLVVWVGGSARAEPAVNKDTADLEQLSAISPALPAGMWMTLMQAASVNLPAGGWERPDNVVQVEVCIPSGQLPTAACPSTAPELFLAGSQPAAYDTLYRIMPVNRRSGLLATVFTPPDLVVSQTFLDVPAQYDGWAARQGIAQPPHEYDPLPALPFDPDVNITVPAAAGYASGQVRVMGTAAGDGFTAYRLEYGQGLYPRGWKALSEQGLVSVRDAALGVWDTTGLDGLYLLRLTVQRASGETDVAYTQVLVDNVPPAVSITWPAETESRYTVKDQPLLLLAQADDRVGIAGVQWYADGRLVHTQTSAPYFLEIILDSGAHIVRAAAWDLAGNTAETADLAITVD